MEADGLKLGDLFQHAVSAQVLPDMPVNEVSVWIDKCGSEADYVVNNPRPGSGQSTTPVLARTQAAGSSGEAT